MQEWKAKGWMNKQQRDYGNKSERKLQTDRKVAVWLVQMESSHPPSDFIGLIFVVLPPTGKNLFVGFK